MKQMQNLSLYRCGESVLQKGSETRSGVTDGPVDLVTWSDSSKRGRKIFLFSPIQCFRCNSLIVKRNARLPGIGEGDSIWPTGWRFLGSTRQLPCSWQLPCPVEIPEEGCFLFFVVGGQLSSMYFGRMDDHMVSGVSYCSCHGRNPCSGSACCRPVGATCGVGLVPRIDFARVETICRNVSILFINYLFLSCLRVSRSCLTKTIM